jgi:hypothetical protein
LWHVGDYPNGAIQLTGDCDQEAVAQPVLRHSPKLALVEVIVGTQPRPSLLGNDPVKRRQASS